LIVSVIIHVETGTFTRTFGIENVSATLIVRDRSRVSVWISLTSSSDAPFWAGKVPRMVEASSTRIIGARM